MSGKAQSLRVTVAPDARGGLGVRVEWRDAPRSTEAALAGITVPDGLGPHKWADRSLLDAAQAELPDEALPLILGTDGAVLEASRANIFAVRDGALLTPPLDGRILPGVTRMRLLQLAGELEIQTREAGLSRTDLLAADEVFLSGSVRGIEPAVSLDGAPLPGSGEVGARIAAELRRAWAGERAAAAFG